MKIFWATCNTIHIWMQCSWRLNLFFCHSITSRQLFLRWYTGSTCLICALILTSPYSLPVNHCCCNTLVLPATTSSCERSFSGLRRLKIYLRSSISQERLNSLIIAAAHTETLDNINLVDIAKDFISRNEAPENMYGNFGQWNNARSCINRLAIHCDSINCCVWFWFSMWF